MRSLVVYSSRTGNTKKIAEAVAAVIPEEVTLVSVEDAPAPDEFDLICLGFWVDKGMPDALILQYMERIHGKMVGLFGTLGAWPDSEHAQQCMDKACELLAGNTVLGTFMCQGKVDPKLLAVMEKMPGMHAAHAMTEERKARIEEAKKHPDAADCARAGVCFSSVAAKAKEELEKR